MKRYAFLSNKKITLLREVNNKEYTDFTGLCGKIGSYIMEAKYINIFNKPYNELLNFIENIKNKNISSESYDINRYVMNYLFSIRTFLDHWETNIKREYKGNQQYFELFKLATSQEYDNHIEYRIVYRLRNYVQHCEMLISNINQRFNENGEKELLVYVSRDRLLSNFKEWKSDETLFLKSLNSEFEILPFFKVMNSCLFRIHDKFINFNVDENFMYDCISVLKIRNQFKDYKGALAIVEYSNDNKGEINKIFSDNNTAMKITELPSKMCELILKSHIKNNEEFIKIFNIMGKCVGKTSTSFPYVTSRTDNIDLFIKSENMIMVNNQKWVRLLETMSIGDINNYTSVYADARFDMKELTNLAKFYDNLCGVLYKN